MLDFLSGLSPWKALAGFAGMVLAMFAIVVFVHSCEKQKDQANANLVNQGATQERSSQQAETINAVQNAQEVTRNPTSDQLNVVCSRYDRNCPTNHP